MSNYSSLRGGPRPYPPTPNAEAVAYEALMKAAFYIGVWLGIVLGKSLVEFLQPSR